MLGKEYSMQKESDDVFKEAISLINDDKLSPYDTYKDVYKKNNDFIAWLSIDDTNINYPVMQTIDNPNYYLRKGFDKAYSPYGVPYIQEDCDIASSYNLIIYGHNTDNGSMFYDLTKYLDEDFYLKHKIIKFDTLDEFGEYGVFVVFKTSIKDGFPYYEYVNGGIEEFSDYISICKNLALYDTNVEVTYGDRLITLSTCEHYYESDGRIVVVAKKID